MSANESKEIAAQSRYKKEHCEAAKKLCLLGATDEDLATFFEVDRRTITNWRNKHSQFKQACLDGKEQADMAIAESLFNKAKDGDITAIIFWLKNRRPDLWRDRRDHNVTGNITLESVLKDIDGDTAGLPSEDQRETGRQTVASREPLLH